MLSWPQGPAPEAATHSHTMGARVEEGALEQGCGEGSQLSTNRPGLGREGGSRDIGLGV